MRFKLDSKHDIFLFAVISVLQLKIYIYIYIHSREKSFCSRKCALHPNHFINCGMRYYKHEFIPGNVTDRFSQR